MSWFDDTPVDHYIQIHNQSIDNSYKPPSVPQLDLRCGPILRLCGTFENDETNYRASILLVTYDPEVASHPSVIYQLGPAVSTNNFNESDLAKGELKSEIIHSELGFVFWRFNINFELIEIEQKCKYTINDSITNQFYIPSVNQSMNVVSYSCNGFSLATPTEGFKSSMWLDVLTKHSILPYHVMIGGGDQIYCDSIKIQVSKLHEYLTEKNPIKKYKLKSTTELENDVSRYYLDNYINWFGVGYWKGKNGETLQSIYPMAMAQIPSINIFDDHDIIDGFGSYHDHTMNHEIMRSIGNIAYKYYMLFQHHTSLEEHAHLDDPNWIISKEEGPFIKQKSHSVYARLGKEIAFLGLDCRVERSLRQIVAPDTYDLVFERLTKEVSASKDNIKHLLVLLGVPIAYPRLVWLEHLLTSPLLKPIQKLAQVGIVAKGLVNEFDGSVEVLDDLNDHWCSSTHKRERNKFVKRLIEFGSSHKIRTTILSGDVHLGCISRFKSKFHHHHLTTQKNYDLNKIVHNPEYDPRLMFNVISSAIVNAPPPNAMANLLNKRSKLHRFDFETDEDVLQIFVDESNNNNYNNDNYRFNNKRNWCDLIPAANSKYHKLVDANLKKFPGPLDIDKPDLETDKYQEFLKEKASKQPDVFVRYPLTENTLVTTLHIEKDNEDPSSKSVDYELFIPDLKQSYVLENVGVKKL